MAFEFHYRRCVAWQDTDAAGIIHFTNYFRYMEEAETQFHLSLGGEFLEAVRQGVYCLRVSVSCDFLKPVTQPRTHRQRAARAVAAPAHAGSAGPA
jgi:acyl-CoA thioester hydrolase